MPYPNVAVLPSLPPSPSLLDEVFGQPHSWSMHLEDFDVQGSRRFSPGSASGNIKRKGKQTVEDEEEDGDTEQRVSVHEAYPPTTDEVAETRQVEETLKCWELAERQRRKSVRDSTQYISRPSFLSNVTRTANLVLSGRTSIGTSIGPGSPRTFKSHETVDIAREGYAVPLEDIDHTPDVTVHSPEPSLKHNTSLDGGRGATSGTSDNPFVHPSERTRTPTPPLTPVTPTPMLPLSGPPSPSPFSDRHAQQAVLPVQEESDLATRVSTESKTKRSLASRMSLVPPPRPLQFPPEDTLHTTQLQPTSRPVLRPPRSRGDSQGRQEVRWWHDWLCGCSEGPDRGGDNQAGRTNPFE